MKKALAIIFAVGILIADAGFGRQVILSMKTIQFKKTQGTITFIALQKIFRDGYDNSKADVAYSYAAPDAAGNVTTHYGTRISYVSIDRNPSFFVNEHPKGAEVDVYYNPANPDDAVLLPDMEPFQRTVVFMLLPLNALALLLLMPAFGGNTVSRADMGVKVFGGLLFMENIVASMICGVDQPLSAMIGAIGVALILATVAALRFDAKKYEEAIAQTKNPSS